MAPIRSSIDQSAAGATDDQMQIYLEIDSFDVSRLTFKRVIKKRSTEGFSCVPYVLALFNSLLYTWYGLPVVSIGWENFPLIAINALGVLLESAFIIIYFWFLVVGFVGLGAAVSMYASPLGVMKRAASNFNLSSGAADVPNDPNERQVVRTKSVEFMPFSLSFFSFLASSLWMSYGLLSHDMLLATPNLVGSPLGMLQLVLYCMYREKKRIGREEANMGVEKNDLQLKGIQPVLISAPSSADQLATAITNV
ncbi:hypothetical protein ACLOJK_010081 [Asimina triloba]